MKPSATRTLKPVIYLIVSSVHLKAHTTLILPIALEAILGELEPLFATASINLSNFFTAGWSSLLCCFLLKLSLTKLFVPLVFLASFSAFFAAARAFFSLAKAFLSAARGFFFLLFFFLPFLCSRSSLFLSFSCCFCFSSAPLE